MNEPVCAAIREGLMALQDTAYRDFQRRLIPGIDPETIIGVRTPQLRAMAGRLHGTPQAQALLSSAPHATFEENQLHSFLIARERDFGRCLALVEDFLPFVDNWATCDQLSPRALGRDLPRLLERVRAWLASGRTYTIRFGVNMLMTWFLDDAFDPCQLDWAAAIDSQEESVRLGVAWYVATALYKQPEATLPLIEARRLEPWTHNRAIRKAIESRRIPEETKAYLRTLSIRGRC